MATALTQVDAFTHEPFTRNPAAERNFFVSLRVQI